MKKIIICLLVVLGTSQFSCKKFLNITPINQLTGNNFYRSVDDIESNIIDMYGTLFQKYTNTNTAGATGEFRSGEVIVAEQAEGWRTQISQLGGHNRRAPNPRGSLDKLTIPAATVINDRTLRDAVGDNYQFQNLRSWNEYYRVIQSANLLVSKLEEGIPALSGDQTKRYIAEAKFIRNYCYFTMVRLYGDVVYYTAAYQKDALPRENMVSVIKKCIEDLKTAKDGLPWTLSNPTQRGVRASRGAVVGLLMNMEMWNAGFDPANKTAYYTETAALGEELMASNAFRLLPLTDWNTVSKGRSEESLFELFSTFNYLSAGSVLRYAPVGETFIHFPYRLPEYDFRYSAAIFTDEYMKKLYPDEGGDGRLAAWFDAPFDNNVETFQLKKFAGNTIIDSSDPNNTANPDNTYLIMRYADAVLLRAEALAELGQDEEAARILNEVRSMRAAILYPGALNDPGNLKDAIFWERAKELMGEGTHYFDLVRTKRVLNKLYTDNPLTPDKFNRGGWTWPIDPSARVNNRLMELNNYWINDGF